MMIARMLFALVWGALFGAGLALSGMSDPQKVIGFLDLFGQWDPSLMFVMLAALLVTVPGFHWALKKRSQPQLEDQYFLPTNSTIDKKLLLGAALFGIGWGLFGVCPGPALVGLVYVQWQVWLFVATMILGMWVSDRFSGLIFK